MTTPTISVVQCKTGPTDAEIMEAAIKHAAVVSPCSMERLMGTGALLLMASPIVTEAALFRSLFEYIRQLESRQ